MLDSSFEFQIFTWLMIKGLHRICISWKASHTSHKLFTSFHFHKEKLFPSKYQNFWTRSFPESRLILQCSTFCLLEKNWNFHSSQKYIQFPMSSQSNLTFSNSFSAPDYIREIQNMSKDTILDSTHSSKKMWLKYDPEQLHYKDK